MMDKEKRTVVTLIPGDGIGPEIIQGVKKIVGKVTDSILWDEVNAGEDMFNKCGELIPKVVYESIEKNRIALKGPITTPIGHGFKSINVSLRQRYDLFTNLRPVMSSGNNTKYEGIDLVIFRENTEGLYIGIEYDVDDNISQAIKVISTVKSERIIREAFEYALKNNRKKVTLVHKANIMKKTDGKFLRIGQEISKEYGGIEFESVIVDNMCMQLVLDPGQFDVIVTTNLYGDILSDLCAGLVGGLGLVPGANIGKDIAIFEAVHGSAPDIAGKNMANPIGILLSTAMMFDYLDMKNEGDQIRAGIIQAIENKKLTRDLGGQLSTTEFVDEVIENIMMIGG